MYQAYDFTDITDRGEAKIDSVSLLVDQDK